MVSFRVRTGGWVGAVGTRKPKQNKRQLFFGYFWIGLWLGLVRALPVWLLFFTAAAFHSL